jgi:hypothetical protein
MKLTAVQLRSIIKEEVTRAVNEAEEHMFDPDPQELQAELEQLLKAHGLKMSPSQLADFARRALDSADPEMYASEDPEI